MTAKAKARTELARAHREARRAAGCLYYASESTKADPETLETVWDLARRASFATARLCEAVSCSIFLETGKMPNDPKPSRRPA
jgi:hypothetical protein